MSRDPDERLLPGAGLAGVSLSSSLRGLSPAKMRKMTGRTRMTTANRA